MVPGKPVDSTSTHFWMSPLEKANEALICMDSVIPEFDGKAERGGWFQNFPAVAFSTKSVFQRLYVQLFGLFSMQGGCLISGCGDRSGQGAPSFRDSMSLKSVPQFRVVIPNRARISSS